MTTPAAALAPPAEIAAASSRAEVARVAVRDLRLVDFRNYPALSLASDGRHVVLAGENGAGKTNVLEALSLLSPGRGLRRARLDDMGRLGAPAGWTVFARLDGPDGAVRLEVLDIAQVYACGRLQQVTGFNGPLPQREAAAAAA